MEMFLLLTVMPLGLIGTLYWLEHDNDGTPDRPEASSQRRRRR